MEKNTQQTIRKETKHCVVLVECGSREQTTQKEGTKNSEQSHPKRLDHSEKRRVPFRLLF